MTTTSLSSLFSLLCSPSLSLVSQSTCLVSQKEKRSQQVRPSHVHFPPWLKTTTPERHRSRSLARASLSQEPLGLAFALCPTCTAGELFESGFVCQKGVLWLSQFHDRGLQPPSLVGGTASFYNSATRECASSCSGCFSKTTVAPISPSRNDVRFLQQRVEPLSSHCQATVEPLLNHCEPLGSTVEPL